MKEILETLADLLLPGVRPYWVLASDNPPPELILPDCAGFTGYGLQHSFRDWLKERGEWEDTPRPVIVLDDAEYSAHCSNANPTNFYVQELIARAAHRLVGTAIHELGHVADAGFDRSPTTDRDVELVGVYLKAARTIDSERRPRSQLNWHGPRWLRVCAHAWHRARNAGLVVSANSIFEGADSYPSVSSAVMATEGEREILEHVPLAELAAIAPPDDYVSLWQFKVRKWRENQPADDPEADRIATTMLNELNPTELDHACNCTTRHQ